MKHMTRDPRGHNRRGGEYGDEPPRFAGTCTAVLGSMTLAMKAQGVLAEAAIRATLTKVSSTRTHGGCAYGVDFPCTQSANVRMILSRAGVRVREYLEG